MYLVPLAASRAATESAPGRRGAPRSSAGHRSCAGTARATAACSMERAIADFLNGKTDGGDVLHAIYDRILDEPVPERLKALLLR